MDRLLREGNPPAGQLASPKPQYKKPGVDEYAPVEGQHGAPFATLKDAGGNVVSPATDEKLEQVKSELELVKSELQTIKDNQLSGDQKVQLSGNNVETQILVNAQAITDTTARSTGFPLVGKGKYRDFDFLIQNTLDKPVYIWFGGLGNSRAVLKRDGTNVLYNGETGSRLSHEIPADMRTSRVLLSALPLDDVVHPHPWKDYMWMQSDANIISLLYVCREAPTSGSLSITFVGRY